MGDGGDGNGMETGCCVVAGADIFILQEISIFSDLMCFGIF